MCAHGRNSWAIIVEREMTPLQYHHSLQNKSDAVVRPILSENGMKNQPLQIMSCNVKLLVRV